MSREECSPKLDRPSLPLASTRDVFGRWSNGLPTPGLIAPDCGAYHWQTGSENQVVAIKGLHLSGLLGKAFMFLARSFAPAFWLLLGLLLLTPQPSLAQERLCDTSFEDCRAPLWQLIDAETVGIDVSFWYMSDASIAGKIINKHNAGVPVRIMVDPRANDPKPANAQRLAEFQAAGIPMRMKVGGGIHHWKMMLFVGQNKVEFSAANFDPFSFVPANPYVDYTDEVIYFSDDPSVVNTFKTKFDNLWTDTAGHANYANITQPLTRRYPTYQLDPDLNFTPGVVGVDYDEFANRCVANYNLETLKIDVIMFRLTDQRHTNALINAINRGVVIRFLAEPREYRSPAKRWHAWNMDRLYMAGVQIKHRLHQGETHEKLAILHGQGLTIFGSSNWTSPSSNSQEEHNYFTHKPSFYQWFSNHFDRKWNATNEYGPFVPLPPAEPTNLSPANGATGQSTTATLTWEGGYWAHKYDIYFGANPNPPLIATDWTTGSIYDGFSESYNLPTLTPGTTYYWRIVGKTMANLTANGPTWSFTTSGTPPQSPTVTAISPNSGPSSGGQAVTITGTGFLAGATVSIGGSPANNVNVASSTSITATTPANSSGPVSVVVTNTDGRSGTLNNGYSYIPPPTVSGISPNSGTTSGGTSVTITGTGFLSGATVNIGGTAATNVVVVNSTSITARTPAHTVGAVNVVVTNTDGQSGTRTNGYTYTSPNPAPTVTGILPTSGTTNGGTSVAISGTGFLSGATVSIGGAAATNVIVVNSTSITASTPAHAIGTVSVVVTNTDGLSGTRTNAYTYTSTNPAPTVTGVSPNSGTTSGGTAITITGTGFLAGASVSIGGSPATNVNVSSGTSLTATTPAHAVGTVNVVVTNTDGQSGTRANGYTYTVPTFTLAASPSTANPGDTLNVTWTAPSGRPANDWIGLYKVGDPETSFISWQYTGGASSGSANFTAPSQAGQYEFRYFTNNSYVRAATSNTVTVNVVGGGGGTFSLAASPSTVDTGQTLNVTWTAPSGRPANDWIALYKVGDPDTSFISWQYTGGGPSGSKPFTAPSQAGQYEFRYFTSNSYNKVATSNTVTVNAVGGTFTLGVSPSTANRGQTLTVTWTAPSGRPANDWVGLYRVGNSDTSYVSWKYTGGTSSGSTTFTAPNQVGQYEFRYFLSDGYTKAAQSNIVTVN
jgi:hypothetical protein